MEKTTTTEGLAPRPPPEWGAINHNPTLARAVKRPKKKKTLKSQ